MGALLLTNPIFDIIEFLIWGIDRVDAFGLATFMTRDTLDLYVSKALVESGRMLPEMRAQEEGTEKEALIQTQVDKILADVSSETSSPEVRAELEASVRRILLREVEPMVRIEPADEWIWEDRLECQARAAPENQANEFYAPPTSACNATYRNAFESYIQENTELFVAQNIRDSEGMANDLYRNERRQQNQRKRNYMTTTLFFITLFLIHMAALFFVIARYR